MENNNERSKENSKVIDQVEYEFIKKVVEIILKNGVEEQCNRSEPVVRYRSPEHLAEIFDFNLYDEPIEQEKLLDIVKEVITFCTKTAHPLFFNQFSAGLDVYSVAGIWLSDIFNANVFTYEASPLFTLMENFIIGQISDLFGYPKDSEGLFSPGGSVANAYAMNIARYNRFPQMKEEGMYKVKKLLIFVSEDSHYSILKMAGLLGIGQRNVICVRTDENGRMDISHLARLMEKYDKNKQDDYIPFMVVATAGTTVLGAFDPIEEIHAICEKYKIWLHVDAAWGGVVVFSEKYKNVLKGIEKSDSFSWSPQKALQIPQQCSLILTRHKGLLDNAHTCSASYLFKDNKIYNSIYDLGDKYLQCGRKPDVFKLWFSWKAKGYSGIRHHVNHLLKHAEYLTDRIKNADDFRLVCQPSFINVCFWHVPDGLSRDEIIGEHSQKIGQLTVMLKEKLLRRGSPMISEQSLRGMPDFFRFVCCSSSITTGDCDFLLSEIRKFGSSI